MRSLAFRTSDANRASFSRRCACSVSAALSSARETLAHSASSASTRIGENGVGCRGDQQAALILAGRQRKDVGAVEAGREIQLGVDVARKLDAGVRGRRGPLEQRDGGGRKHVFRAGGGRHHDEAV